MELDNAALPPPKRRGRPPKVKPQENTVNVVWHDPPVPSQDPYLALIEAKTAARESGWSSELPQDAAFLERNSSYGKLHETGWTTGAFVKSFPTEGYSFMVGGAFNGQEKDMRAHGLAKLVALPLDEGRIEWYERGVLSGYYWVASVTPQGIELRDNVL